MKTPSLVHAMSQVYFPEFFFSCHQFLSLSFPEYSTFSAISGSFLANLHLTPPLFSIIEMLTSTAVEVSLPPGKFSKLALCASSLLHCRKLLTKIHRTTSLLLYRLLKPHGVRKPSSTVELLLSCDHCWRQQPLVFYCILETGAACPEPEAVTELPAPARQDTDAQSPEQCTSKCNNSLLFSTFPCRDSTLNSEELAHPKIQKNSLFVRVNMGYCYRKQ